MKRIRSFYFDCSIWMEQKSTGQFLGFVEIYDFVNDSWIARNLDIPVILFFMFLLFSLSASANRY